MKKQIFFLAAAIILFIGNNLPANVTIEFPLDCAGTYNVGQGWSTDFDLGVEFTDISHVYIDWEGEMTASLARFFDNPDNLVPVDSAISAVLGEYPSWRYITIPGGESTYPSPESCNINAEFLYGSMPLSELYDGKGKIRISYTVFSLTQVIYDEYGQVTLNNAKLVIDGIPIPEPTTFILVSIGLLGIRLSRKKLNIIT